MINSTFKSNDDVYSRVDTLKSDSNLNTLPFPRKSTISKNPQLAKYLAQILKPLGQSQYTIKSSKSFMKTLKKQKIPPGYQIVSFDIVSLFTNVPLEETINIIIIRIYDKNKINTNIQKQEMKDLLYLCTKNAHFTLNSKTYVTYVQIDGIAVGSPIDSVLANIVTVV